MTEPRQEPMFVQLFFNEELGATALDVWRPQENSGKSVISLRFTAEEAQQLYGGRPVLLEVQETEQ